MPPLQPPAKRLRSGTYTFQVTIIPTTAGAPVRLATFTAHVVADVCLIDITATDGTLTDEQARCAVDHWTDGDDDHWLDGPGGGYAFIDATPLRTTRISRITQHNGRRPARVPTSEATTRNGRIAG